MAGAMPHALYFPQGLAEWHLEIRNLLAVSENCSRAHGCATSYIRKWGWDNSVWTFRPSKPCFCYDCHMFGGFKLDMTAVSR